MRFRFSLVIVLCLAFMSVSLSAQKVGLVLSGGGAKGVAHIGVIRALEEEGIPINYITGTSMGAIIGALYASGYSPDEMEKIVKSADFAGWVSGKVDEQYTYLFKKSIPDASWAEFKFRIDSVFTPFFPTNLVSPVVMDFAFLEIFSDAGAASGYNFDNLMVPYRCIAADVSRGEALVLKNGDLGSAVRASMTFPFFFKPIRIDGKLLFDGGMYNNFPADIMYEQFFPDIIIGSQVAANYEEPKDDDVMSQLQSMLMQRQDYSVMCENGVLIRPILQNVNVIDFSYTPAFIDSGYAMAKRWVPEIRKFVVDIVDKEEIAIKRATFISKKPQLNIGNLKVSGLKGGQYEYVNQLLQISTRKVLRLDSEFGQKPEGITLKKIKPEYFKLIAEDKIEHIYPQLIYDSISGLFDLYLNVQRENQLITGVGGAVTSSSVNELFVRLQYNYWTRLAYQANANAYFGRFYNSAMIEGRMDIPGYSPFFLKARFTYNKFNYFKTNTYFFEDEDPFFLIEKENFLTLLGGFPISNRGILMIDFVSGRNRDDYFQVNFYNRLDTLDKTTFSYFSPGVGLEINSLNRKEYASSGVRLLADVRFISGKEKFSPGSTAPFKEFMNKNHKWIQANFLYENYFKQLHPLSFGFSIQAFYSSQEYFLNYTSTILSVKAYQPFPEALIRFMPQFRASRFVALGSKNIVEIRKNIDFRIEAHLFAPIWAIQQDYLTRQAKSADEFFIYGMGTSALVYHSPIGPISLNLNYFYKEPEPFSFFMKFGYLIFNKRPF